MMKRLLIATAFAACTLSAFALPSIDKVQAELASGHYIQAEEMMREVIAAKPDSARARYVYAEILAHEQRFAQAAEEAAQAQQLDPSLSFTQPEKFKAFSELLAREQGGHPRSGSSPATHSVVMPHAAAAPAPLPSPLSGGVPAWAWLAGLGLLGVGCWRLLGTRQGLPVAGPGLATAGGPAPSAGWPPAGTGAGTGYGSPGMPWAPQAPAAAPAPGAGLLGTGLAVAGGVAAGMLAERLIETHREPVANLADIASNTSATGLPGLTPGVFDEPSPERLAAQALEERPIDLGRGDGWGGDDSVATMDSGSDSDGW